MAALSRRNFDYTSAEIEVSEVRGSGCDIRCSSFEFRGSSRFKFQVSIRDTIFVVRAASHGSRFTVHDSRFTSYDSRVTRLESRKRIKKRSKKLLSHYFILTKYYFTNDFKYCP